MATIKQLYDLEGFKTFTDSLQIKAKDSAGLMLERQLQYLSPKLFERKYPDLRLLNTGISINNEGGYANTITSLRTSATGSFIEAQNRSANKGMISVEIGDSTAKVFDYSAGSTWSHAEVKTAELQGINLVNRFIKAHNEIYLHNLDSIGLVGADGLNGSGPATGLLNHPGFVSSTAAAHGSGSAEDDYNVVSNLISSQQSDVDGTEAYSASVVLMSIPAFKHLETTPFNATMGAGQTILSVLKMNFPNVSFQSSPRCNSVGGSSVTIAFSVNEESMVLRIPVPLFFSPIEQQGLSFMTESAFRYAGVDVLEDKAGKIVTGF